MAVHFLDANALFIHIPKTGGTWVERAARQANLRIVRLPERTTRKLHKHLTRDRYGYGDALAWTVVRRPDEWYVSWYRYAMARDWPTYRKLREHPQSCLADCASPSFEQFIECCLSKHRGYLSAMYARYTAGLDFVGTTENLPSDFRRVLGPRLALPALDPTPVHVAKSLRPSWPAGLRERLLAAEHDAMRLWQAAFVGEQLRTPRAA